MILTPCRKLPGLSARRSKLVFPTAWIVAYRYRLRIPSFIANAVVKNVLQIMYFCTGMSPFIPFDSFGHRQNCRFFTETACAVATGVFRLSLMYLLEALC